jgi:hypothetical protein
MNTILFIYASGAFWALYFYHRHYEYTIPHWEIAITWFYQLPKMLTLWRQKNLEEKLQNEKYAKFWSKELFKAYKIAEKENWTVEDWERWNIQMEYNKIFM